MQIDLNQFTEDRPRKKLKVDQNRINLEDYKDGSIIKLRLHNFVTYKLTEFTLSPSLNMIIGPNGSGKSTFVCAVCLGLAGKTEFIGRTKNVEGFIKNGEDMSKIETFLRDSRSSSGMIKVTRIIYRKNAKRGGSSTYKLDEREVSEQQIRQLIINHFNIQLDNLCQFLSQERVEEFARLKSDKLLVETIRSIDPNLLILFNNLKTLQTQENKTQKDINIKKVKLEDLREKKEVLNKKVSLLKEYETKIQEIEYHKALLPYVYIKDHKLKLETYKNDYREAKNELKKVLNDRKPFIANQNTITSRLETFTQKQHEIKNSIKSLEEILNGDHYKFGKITDEISSQKSKIEMYGNRTERIKNLIREQQSELVEKRKDLDKYAEVLPKNEHITKINEEKEILITKQQNISTSISQLTNQANQHNRDIDQLGRQIQSIERQLTSNDMLPFLDKLRGMEEVKKAVLHVRGRHDVMGSSILEPPIMTVSMDTPQLASYLNHMVDYNTSKAFTMVNSETYVKFEKEMLQYIINLRELSPKFDINQGRLPIEEVRSYGFDGYLSDFVKGNPVVIKMLCQINQIHLIPFSSRGLSVNQLERLSPPYGKIPFPKFIDGNSAVTLIRGTYGSKQIIKREIGIRRTDLYQVNVMTEEDKADIQRRINDRRTQIEDKKRLLEDLSSKKGELTQDNNEINKKLDSFNTTLRKWGNIRNKHSSLLQDIETLKESIEGSKREANKDVSEKIAEVKRSIKEKVISQSDLVLRLVQSCKKLKRLEDEATLNDIKLFETKNLRISLTDVIKVLTDRETELKEEYQNKKETVRKLRDTNDYMKWMQKIQNYNDNLKGKLNQFAEKYEAEGQFNVTFIQDMIEKLQSEISTINHDTSSITILKKVETDIKDLETELPKLVTSLDGIKTHISNDHEELVPKLSTIIDKISEKFGELFVNVGSAGEVKLEKPNSYSEWSIEILVKFRDIAQLQRLDSHTQSGGERAVSTVLYMIALQEFAAAPFRVVDEINQGMDQRNERIVHKAMVENACAENTSQYFLITPKLLTNLYYHEKMRIHCVMAGPWIPNPSEDIEMIHFGETSNYVL